ncbi:hypothetical protein KC939_01895 [Candidatus Saccharibacteria bacterium]|nr:hypothetical protein [Candidatus Saccharibacteria bacterium]
MSKRENFTAIEKTAQSLLEPSLEESQLKKSMKEANASYAGGYLDDHQFMQYLFTFNQQWQHHSEVLKAYGVAISNDYHEEVIFNEDSNPIFSLGFGAQEIDGCDKIGYQFATINMGNNTVQDIFWADIDEFYIDTSMHVDGVQATHLFEHFYPDIAAELSDRYFKAETDIDFVLGLKNFSINHDSRHHQPQEADPDEVRNLLTKMLDHQVPLKATVPWSVAFSGIYFPIRPDLSINHEDAKVEYAWQKWLAIPRGIVMLPNVEIDEAEDCYRSNPQLSKPAISLFIFPAIADKEPQGEMVIVPITENLKIVSNVENIETFEDLEDS